MVSDGASVTPSTHVQRTPARTLHKILDEYISLRAIHSIHLQNRSRNDHILIFTEEQMELLEVRRFRPQVELSAHDLFEPL